MLGLLIAALVCVKERGGGGRQSETESDRDTENKRQADRQYNERQTDNIMRDRETDKENERDGDSNRDRQTRLCRSFGHFCAFSHYVHIIQVCSNTFLQHDTHFDQRAM